MVSSSDSTSSPVSSSFRFHLAFLPSLPSNHFLTRIDGFFWTVTIGALLSAVVVNPTQNRLDHSSWRVRSRSFSYHPSHVLELLLRAGLSTQCLLI